MDRKYSDLTQTGVIANDPSGLGSYVTGVLNGVAAGSSQQQRIGNRIFMSDIQVRGVVQLDPNYAITVTNAPVMPIVMVALVMDTQTNSTAIDGKDVWETAAQQNAAQLYRDLEFSTRYKVLKRKTINVGAISEPQAVYAGSTIEWAWGGKYIPFSFYVNLKNLMVQYTGTSAGIGDIQDNSIWLMAISNKVTGNSVTLNIHSRSRLRFRG